MAVLLGTLAEVLVAFVVIVGLAAVAKNIFFDKKEKNGN
jgi:competence protein ComGF